MKLLVAILGSLLLLAIAAFCAFGFMASFEPTDNAWAFRIGYAVVGIACLVGVVLLIVNVLRRRRSVTQTQTETQS